MLDYSKKPNKKRPSLSHSEQRILNKNDDLIDLFPLPRYFQVHFTHIHENTEVAQHKLDQLKQTLTKLETKLDRFIALLDHHIEL